MVKVDRNGFIAVMVISRPEALNALNSAMLSAVLRVVDETARDESVRAVVITGEGKAFAAGADIAEMQGFSKHEALKYGARGSAVFAAVEAMPQPVIAAVNGVALGGGCELALSCDIRLASEKARFGQPEVSLGITPGFGGTQRLPRAIGMSAAMELIFTGRTIDAKEAHRLGLVHAVYPQDALLDQAVSLAAQIAENAPLAVRAAKRVMRRGMDLSMVEAVNVENEMFATCFETEDQREAMAAFVKKRKPMPFKGR